MKIYYYLFLVALYSCQSPEQQLDGYLLPNSFQLKGSAYGEVNNLLIECICDLVIEISDVVQIGDLKMYKGTHGGHFGRTVLQSDGSGISLVPDVFGELIIYQYKDKHFTFSIPINKGTGVPFYEQISSMEGCLEGTQLLGDWLCAPFETRGDSIGIIEGDWQVE